MLPNLDWRAIRPLGGSRHAGFEELCAQLARRECSSDADFKRKGTPDSGVECYAVLPDGTEWAWQAKYFESLTAGRWRQIDKSVKSALDGHPHLSRYYVCVPTDLPDARKTGQTSARDQWNQRVTKWSGWTAEREMEVEFVFWGSSELLERLSHPENVGRVRFWFDAAFFDSAWFDARLAEAIAAAGPRYTPKVHVDLPIAASFKAFGRTEDVFDGLKAHARTLRDKLRPVTISNSPAREAGSERDKNWVWDEKALSLSKTLEAAVQVVLEGLAELVPLPSGPLPFKRLIDDVDEVGEAVDSLKEYLLGREAEHESLAVIVEM